MPLHHNATMQNTDPSCDHASADLDPAIKAQRKADIAARITRNALAKARLAARIEAQDRAEAQIHLDNLDG